jgi:hypothetical protein
MNKRHLLGLLAALPLALLSACGGGNSDGNDANVRLVNASAGYASLDLYVDDVKEMSAVDYGTASDYTAVKSGAVSKVFTPSGSSTALLTKTDNFASNTKYTAVAFGWEGALKSVNFVDDESAADSGKTKVLVYNGAIGAGILDVYLTGEDETLESSEPIATAVAEVSSGSSGYVSVTSGTYRLRVTATGDTEDVRLDVSGVTISSTGVVTFVVTPGAGGVLVNAIGVVQGGTVTPYLNANARVRLVPAVAGSAPVGLSVGEIVVASSAQSPSIGDYVLVPAGAATIHSTVSGTSLADKAVTLTPGSDSTILVAGTSVATSVVNVIPDDNRLPSSTSQYKIRLIHAAPSLASDTMSMTVNFGSVAAAVAFGTASTFSNESAATAARLDLLAPSLGNFFTSSDLTLSAGAVYTVFAVDTNTPPPVGTLSNAR